MPPAVAPRTRDRGGFAGGAGGGGGGGGGQRCLIAATRLLRSCRLHGRLPGRLGRRGGLLLVAGRRSRRGHGTWAGGLGPPVQAGPIAAALALPLAGRGLEQVLGEHALRHSAARAPTRGCTRSDRTSTQCPTCWGREDSSCWPTLARQRRLAATHDTATNRSLAAPGHNPFRALHPGIVRGRCRRSATPAAARSGLAAARPPRCALQPSEGSVRSLQIERSRRAAHACRRGGSLGSQHRAPATSAAPYMRTSSEPRSNIVPT